MSGDITSFEVSEHLTASGHTDSVHRSAWRPGYRDEQNSRRTVYVWHDGHDERQYLDRYAQSLRAAGYEVTLEQPRGGRPHLCVRRC
ncbi:hypothetical protein [Streptomyces tauricus]|uniref:hypothetical protein n=1 Tax=Streptomyces tauricus TaxID=68274 RepID=UPI002244113B|nr:hypothetical protein [Streptomyces tauricus]MCW8103541.1 hypothetical protein [Streptomyces tauricus]